MASLGTAYPRAGDRPEQPVRRRYALGYPCRGIVKSATDEVPVSFLIPIALPSIENRDYPFSHSRSTPPEYLIAPSYQGKRS